MHDSQVAIPLATITAGRVTNLYDLMDSAYDVAAIKQHSRDLNHACRSSTSIRVPHLDWKQELADEAKCYAVLDTAWRNRFCYGERSAAERVNGGLKDNHGGRTRAGAWAGQSDVSPDVRNSGASRCCNWCASLRNGKTRAASSPLPACRRARTLPTGLKGPRNSVARHKMWWDLDGITDFPSPAVALERKSPKPAPMILQVVLLKKDFLYPATKL